MQGCCCWFKVMCDMVIYDIKGYEKFGGVVSSGVVVGNVYEEGMSK